MKALPFLKKHAITLLLCGGLGAFVLIAGTTGSCRICSTITEGLGIPSLRTTTPVAAPAWQLRDLDGVEFSSADLAGKVVLIDFWATWCPPCRRMIPGMVALQEQYRDQGLVIVGISLDEGGPAVVRTFNEEFGVNYTSLMGNAEVVQAFGGVTGIPTSFLLDREGRIVQKHVGYVSRAKLEAEIKPLL